ncbi:MAG: methionyl-tRNA formyltransferase [Candidatus Dadabacteria bacterium]|nr:MAG: methionyl-tRNA formyltransferase [Candidatus Dadabacteria bacterium]
MDDLNARLAAGATPPLRTIFMGTPEIAVPLFEALIQDELITVDAVVSQPDRPAGRGRRMTAPAVVQAARSDQIPVHQPERLRDVRSELEELQPDLLVVMAYGKILPGWLLDLPRIAPLNVHASLLPRHRGASPIQSAILAGDEQTGVSLMAMTPEMDAGPVLCTRSIPITDDDDAGRLHDAIARLAAEMWPEASARLVAGTLQACPQDDEAATYCRKLTPADRRIDWSRPAVEIARQVRAFSPRPGASTTLAGQPLKILAGTVAPSVAAEQLAPGQIVAVDPDGIAVATGDGVYRVRRLQSAGGRPLSVGDWLRGHALRPGARLGE